MLVNTGTLMEDKQTALYLRLGASSFFCDGKPTLTEAHWFSSGASNAHYRLNKDLVEVAALVRFIMLNSVIFRGNYVLFLSVAACMFMEEMKQASSNSCFKASN